MRNAFGSEIQSREKQILSNSKSNKLMQEYKNKSYLLEAENIFYQYQIAIESIEVQRESLKRANTIRDYTLKKYKQRLSEKTDYLQAKAIAKQRELDLQMAQSELRQLKYLVFNFMGEDSLTKNFLVEKLSLDTINVEKLKNSNINRLDTASLKEAIEVQKAQNQINLEALKPDLNLKLGASFYGRNEDLNESVDGSFSSDNPVYTIGLSLSMPLDFSALKKAKSAYRRNIQVAQYEYERKVFEDKNNFSDLSLKINEGQSQLKTLKQLVEVQKEKYENEAKILKKGRSTTFQVLSFEQEYLSTQLRLIQLKSNIANLTTQRKLYF